MDRRRRKRRKVGEKNMRGLRGRVSTGEAVVTLPEGSEKNGGSGEKIWKPIAKRANLALEESGEHEIGVGPAVEKTGIAGEEDASAGASEGH